MQVPSEVHVLETVCLEALWEAGGAMTGPCHGQGLVGGHQTAQSGDRQ